MIKIVFHLTFIFASLGCISQKLVTISGKIQGLKNAKIYLGNKSLSFGSQYLIFDSVILKNGNFKFANFKFKEIDFYSIQVKGSSAWLPFLIDTGHIYIVADKGFLSLGKVSGSRQNDLFQLYSKNIVGPYFIANRSDFDSINKYRKIDSLLFKHYSELLKTGETKYLVNREKFIEQHPDSYVSLIILNEIQNQIPVVRLHFYFNLLSPELQQHSKAIKLRKRLREIREK
jgi:hypothetical protein